MERIIQLLSDLPGHSLVHGGSHQGKLYTNYTIPPLDTISSHRHNTQARIDFLLSILGDVKGKTVLDVGCGNGAISLGLAKEGAIVTGWDIEPAQVEIARIAAQIADLPVTFRCITVAGSDVGEDFDIILYLSVFKWVWRNVGEFEALNTLTKLTDRCRTMIFESGVCDSGLDLVPVRKSSIKPLLVIWTDMDHIVRVGEMPDEDPTIHREVWKLWR